ncbi:uncharacterized protein LOC112036418 isoform X1 [Quercus suber]|uniref:uncharacterized protein LOC112036418 isoform X1 n=1 Tax=Quercus suber TaxID=58331 RepID=UPI0032E04163
MRTCCGYFVIVGCITFWMLMKEYCTHEYYFDIIERIQFFYYSPPDQVHWEFSSMNGEGEFSSMRYAFVVLFACLEVDVDNFLYIRVDMHVNILFVSYFSSLLKSAIMDKKLGDGIAIGSHVYNVYYGQSCV